MVTHHYHVESAIHLLIILGLRLKADNVMKVFREILHTDKADKRTTKVVARKAVSVCSLGFARWVLSSC